MSVIKKLGEMKQAAEQLSDIAVRDEDRDGDNYHYAKSVAYGHAIDIVASSPDHTAREKAKRVAELPWLEPGSVIWFDPEFEDDYGEVYPSWINAIGPFINSFDTRTDLTPTPEEIATGCCCYVVPEKGETDEQ